MMLPEKCVASMRYKLFKNNRLRAFIYVNKVNMLRLYCNAFSGSTLGTLNYLLCGGLTWILRLNDDDAPTPSIPVSADGFVVSVVWSGKCYEMDSRILKLSKNLECSIFMDNQPWFLCAVSRKISILKYVGVMLLSNNQTHNSGQILAINTSAGQNFNSIEIFSMPKDQ